MIAINAKTEFLVLTSSKFIIWTRMKKEVRYLFLIAGIIDFFYDSNSGTKTPSRLIEEIIEVKKIGSGLNQ